MTTAATPLSVYQLRIVLRGISPLIWRRVLVPSTTTLAHLHTVLQILFAWSDEHLHGFHIHGKEYGSSGAQTHDVQTASQHYLPPWGMKPTVSDRRNLVKFHPLTRAH